MFNKSFSVFATLLLLSTVFFFACKKDNSAVSGTKWSVDNYNFQANNNGGVLAQSDTGAVFGAATQGNSDWVLIAFKSNLTPGIYKVVNASTKKNKNEYAANECLLSIKHGKDKIYLPLFDDAGVINITQSGQKFTATFSNIRLGYPTENLDVIEVSASGTIIEK